MEHKQIKMLMSQYIDNMLDSDQMEEIRIHLESCPACKEEYETMLIIRETLSELPQSEIPAGFDERLRKSLDTTEQVKPNRIRKSLVAVAAVMTLGVLSVFSFDGIVDVVPGGTTIADKFGITDTKTEQDKNDAKDGKTTDSSIKDGDVIRDSDGNIIADGKGNDTSNKNSGNSNNGATNPGSGSSSNGGGSYTPGGDLDPSNGNNGNQEKPKPSDPYSQGYYQSKISGVLAGYDYSFVGSGTNSDGSYWFKVLIRETKYGEYFGETIPVTGKNGNLSPNPSAWGVPGL